MSDAKRAVPRGRLWVISAPSGAGKTTLVRTLLERDSNLKFSISFTTRPKRHSERNGVDYFFVDDAEFRSMIRRDAFLEYAQVFDNWYGTGLEHVESLLAQGHSVLLEIDWQGARQVRSRAPESASIFVLPPNVAELERRLRGRATDSETTIRRRLADAVADMTHWDEFDFVVINDRLEAAVERLQAIVRDRGGSHRTDSATVRAAAEKVLAGAATWHGPPRLQ
jgi:guanylate kinase